MRGRFAPRIVGVISSLMLVSFGACGENETAGITACASDAPLEFVYAEYGVTDQESSRVMGLDREGNELRVVPHDDYAFQPAFSPDGSQVAFLSRRLDTSDSATNFDLYVIDPDGGNERPVELKLRARDPSWSPDGEWILFVGDYASKEGGIYRIHPNGEGLEKIVSIPEPLRPHSPVLSPDGSQLAWAQWDISDESGSHIIRVADADGSNVRTLTEVGGAELVDWSPDGSKLASSSLTIEDGQSVVVVDVESGDQERVAEDAMGARWNVDGTKLLYSSEPESSDARLVFRDMESGDEEPVSDELPQTFGFQFDVDPLPCSRR